MTLLVRRSNEYLTVISVSAIPGLRPCRAFIGGSMSDFTQTIALLSIGALTIPALTGCDHRAAAPTKASDAYPSSLPVRQGSPNTLETDIAAFLQDHSNFLGQRVQLPITENQLTFVEQRQLYPSDDGSLLYVYDLSLGGTGAKYRVFSSQDIEGAAAISGAWSAFGESYYLAAHSVLVQRVDNGEHSWLWRSLTDLPPPTGEPTPPTPSHP